MKKSKFSFFCFVIIFAGFILSSSCAADFVIRPGHFSSPFQSPCHGAPDTMTISTLKADFTVRTTVGTAPFEVQFYDTSYGFPDYYSWDFGDDSSSNKQYPIHTYTEPGVYDVSLSVSENYYYETSKASYNATGQGQLTSIDWESTERKIAYITVKEEGEPVDEDFDPLWYPVREPAFTMPSGLPGVSGTANLDVATVTITNNTQAGYVDKLYLNGIYRVHKTISYNSDF